MRDSIQKFLDVIGKIVAVVLVVLYVVALLNANFHFLPAGKVVTSIMNIARNYGALILIAIVGLEAVSKMPFVVRIIFYVLLAVIVVFLFFPGTYSNLMNIVTK